MPSRNPDRRASVSPSTVVRYTNRMREIYYLHEGTTKRGPVRYFAAKTIREGALSAMPDGCEFSESINGVVSVCKIGRSVPKIPTLDLTLAASELARHAHLGSHRIEEVKGEIVIFEPEGGREDMSAALGRALSIDPEHLRTRVSPRAARVRYRAVMKFVPSATGPEYRVHRMTYRSDGGWSWPLAAGRLPELLKRYVRHVGTDQFFELL